MINTIFTNNYNEEAFAEFIQRIIPSLSLSKKKSEIRTGFKSIQQIAEASENNLDLVVFVARPDSSLHARVEITKNTYTVLKNHARSNALVAYISDDSSEWRLSLVTTKVTRTKDGIKESVSNPRRFSYVLGPSAKVATPSKMLQGVINSIADLENKFSLAVVSKDFYTQIATQYSKLVGGTRGEGRKAIIFERTLRLGNISDSINANFAIRLIGRLVFCWFLKQKKGHLNNPLIPSEILSVSAVKKIGDYYHSICVPLFFEVLNKPQNSRPAFFSYSEFFDKVPFLNGGLFQDHIEDDHKFNRTTGMSERRGVVSVPDVWFSELFQVFEEYNFTIDENTSIDTELSIDPEMLGRIFENLLAEVNPETGASARKSTGSFYTPREIVDFMVEESLVAHLKNKTNISEEKLRALSSYDLEDDASNPLNQQERKLLVEAIHSATVLDPACGSGAFPIGVLQRMVHMLGALDPECSIYLNKLPPEVRRQLQKHSLAYVRKLGVIRECIHGVDIQPIAIDISRLRCFLTLVVDQRVDDNADNRGIEPLPNLDFKFVCANTLIKPPIYDSPLFGDEFADALGELIDEYFAPVDQLHKLETARKLQQLISNKTKEELESILKSYSYIKNEKYKNALAQQNEKSDMERLRINNLWGSYENIFLNKPVGFFDTRYFFPVVFRNGGFDIVIGNPPYVGESGHKEMFGEIKNSPLGKRFYQGKMDFFYFFFHAGLDNLRDNGMLAFITTNYYPTANGAIKLRKDFYDRTNIVRLINFGEITVFDSARGQHNLITILEKANAPSANYVTQEIVATSKGNISSDALINILSGDSELVNVSKVKKSSVYDAVGDNFYIRFVGGDSKLTDLLDKISKNRRLKEIANINAGVQTSADRFTDKHHKNYPKIVAKKGEGIFIFPSGRLNNLVKNTRLIKPWFKNADATKWITNNNNQSELLLSNFIANKEQEPGVIDYLTRFREILINRSQPEHMLDWWDLHQIRMKDKNKTGEIKKMIFDGPKLVSKSLQHYNDFAYNDIPWYAPSGAQGGIFYITKREDVNVSLKYLLGVLNSKLIYAWLYNRGKRKGEMLALSGTPLAEIPIPRNSELEPQVAALADQIIAIKTINKNADINTLEFKINQLVYKLYDLTPAEIAIIENS